MSRVFFMVAIAAFCTGCATKNSTQAERNATATSLVVNDSSIGHDVVAAVPPESAMERFGMIDRDGHHLAYVAFTDTDFGGAVFVDNKFYGTVSKRDARAFYSCRGYTTATHYHWARDALDWADALMTAVTPAKTAKLNFSGKTTVQSIKEVVGNPALSDVRSLINMGTNPLSIFSKLSSAHSNMVEREQYEKTLQALRSLAPGDSEDRVAQIVNPEDVSFTSDGLVMAYPKFSLDFYVNGGVVKVLQQPSFHRLGRMNAAIFYMPDLHWDQCTPTNWRSSLPLNWPTLSEDRNAGNSTPPTNAPHK